MSLQIRALIGADAQAFQALRLQGLLECPLAFSSSHEEEAGTSLATVGERLVEPGGAVFGAFDNGVLVGLSGVRREAQRKLAHKAFIWGVYVAPGSRRTGAGRRLLTAALAYAGETLRVRQLMLGVHDKNLAAIALYRGLGFEPFGLERGFIRVDGVLHDELHMACALEE